MSQHFVEVALPVPMRQLFTYAISEALNTPNIIVGERVLVPFSGRQLVGIVIKTAAATDIASEKIKPIIARVTDKYPLPPALLKFLITLSRYYHHPIGDICQQALPVLLRQIEQPDLSFQTRWFAREDNADTDIEELSKRAKKQAELYATIAHSQGSSWPELRTLGFSKAQLNALVDKAYIKEKEIEPSEFEWQEGALFEDNRLSLSTEQAVIVSAVNQSNQSFSCHLVDGITGSGKTEVYLQAMENVLAANKQVLVLVPEIGLTPQTLARFEQRFDVPIYLHHSGLNDKERLDTWRAAYIGHAAIIIGTRSSIFTPAQALGLIIVDEEHDNSLKQQDTFRYQGRDCAILRAQQLNIPIILGSATPSLESLQNAFSHKFHYHQLTRRAGNSVQSQLSLVDLNQEHLDHGIGESVKQAISATLQRKEQVLIFLNRRGFAPAINCKECHWVVDCQRCNKPYTFHQNDQLLICHHCGSQKRIIKQCQQCGSSRLSPVGQGTEQLEQHLSQWFSDKSVVRIDRDSTRRKGELTKLLQAIHNKEHDILLGTQMLAKGHHFPDVTLVVILDVDGALFSYDFRAPEQMAQLLVQVAGRAGRASKPGKVLIQTQYPQHPLLQDLVNNGYRHFAQQALTERKFARLPPFGYQILLRAEANYPSYPAKFLSALCQYQYQDCELAGPIPAAMEKKAGKYRYHLIVQSAQRKSLHQATLQILSLMQSHELSNKVRWSIDVDPVDFSW
ncbi:primosomal protein N' [Thalassotalea sp. M1531]|uniref:Replication restart protein PriA n=1 Tax=Thalassotalea algicola TaxID=2716224 RepID=A0A7Y0LHU9_9GAMM|nr:primosomal protein N' [Thalassotalea algicola]NMP33535.1 primosomal protein N' [Thalassotalea algicola]